MAINLHLIEMRHLGRAPGESTMLPVMPPFRRQVLAAAGASAHFMAGTKVYSVQNFGDAVWFRVNKDPEVTQASLADSKSVYLPAGVGTWDFMLPSDVDPELYFIDVRAVA